MVATLANRRDRNGARKVVSNPRSSTACSCDGKTVAPETNAGHRAQSVFFTGFNTESLYPNRAGGEGVPYGASRGGEGASPISG
jgi:hypothetical protein